jgi:hypothetical protein
MVRMFRVVGMIGMIGMISLLFSGFRVIDFFRAHALSPFGAPANPRPAYKEHNRLFHAIMQH